jgi:hypothetical protein
MADLDLRVWAWLNPAGGLRYHVRALASGRRWAPFRASLAEWLGGFEPGVPRAVLVGPSAGYTLPDAFLRRFTAITVLEPDPIAGFLLTRRLRRLGVAELRLEQKDQLILPLLTGRPGLVETLRSDPRVCLIFGNLLGQTRFLLPEPEFERFKAAFRERIWPLLKGRSWLAFHDRLSGDLAPSFKTPFLANARLDDAAVLRELYPPGHPGAPVELFDHRSDGFFPSQLPHHYFTWQIDRRRYHLIEGVASSSGAASSAPGLLAGGAAADCWAELAEGLSD